MAKRRTQNRRAHGPGVSSLPPRVTRSLGHTARRGFNTSFSSVRRHSAKSLISTVLDDTKTPQVRRSFHGYSLSGYSRSRALQRASRTYTSPFGQFLGKVVSIPKRAWVCARRRIRREVLFAMNLRGKGSGAPRRVRSDDSKEKCK